MALTDSLVSYYSLNGNSNDAVGGHNNGVDVAITYSSGNGIIPQGAGFARATVSTIVAAGTESLGTIVSIQCWFKTSDANSSIGGLFRMKTTNPQFALRFGSDYKVKGYAEDDASAQTITLSSTATYNDGLWHHAVFTRNGSAFVLYVDGAQVDSGTNVSMGNISNVKPTIGGAVSDYYDGAIDECGYWSRLLTAAEVSQLYNGGAALAYPPTASSVFPRSALLGVGR